MFSFKRLSSRVPFMLGGISCTVLLNKKYECKKVKHQTYIWGNGQYQARPDAILQFKNFCPKLIKNLPDNLIHLEFGQFYEAGIDDEGNLFIWDVQVMDANLRAEQKEADESRQNIVKLAKNIKEVKFTTGYIWVLTHKKEVIQYPILKDFDAHNNIISRKLGQQRVVDPLKGAISIQAGLDHIITLTEEGNVFAMGDDTQGQCGQADTNRNTHSPFVENRIKYPVQVKNIRNIAKIAAGGKFNLALGEGGNLFGWGSNSSMQLSHEEEFSRMNTPLLCSYNPIKISKNLDGNEIREVVAGQQFTVLVTTNRSTDSQEVFTVGSNLRGQLGIGQIRHIRDITKVESLSNFIMKVKGKEEKVRINQLKCGRTHCIALLNIGYIMEWGDNEYGQLGNKKRSQLNTPAVMRDFAGKKIVGVFAGEYCSGVIVEKNEQDDASKNPKK